MLKILKKRNIEGNMSNDDNKSLAALNQHTLLFYVSLNKNKIKIKIRLYT